jgi:hypothetical protein
MAPFVDTGIPTLDVVNSYPRAIDMTVRLGFGLGMDAATENLLRELETSPTDLKRLVISALVRSRTAIAIEAEAIARWERDDPRSWSSVQDWLLSQNITITVLRSRPSPPPYHLLPPPPTPQPPAANLPN